MGTDKDIQSPKNIFVFNLGRLWQEASTERWDNAMYLYEFIQEITHNVLLEKYSKKLMKLRIAIERKDCNSVDKTLEAILKW